MIRAIILAATAASLLCLYVDRPKPVLAGNVPYCWQPEWNVWEDVVGGRFLPCSEQDTYRYI